DLDEVTILDVGCGTGELLLRLLKEGAHVTGVDLSADMLAITRQKCESFGFKPMLLEQSMTELNLAGFDPFCIITLFCDSLNYLETEEDVQKTFQNIYNHLDQDGVLLFDVHSIFKMEEGFIG